MMYNRFSDKAAHSAKWFEVACHLLHAYHSEAQTVVPIRRNSKTDEVAQGREM
jgi:hypothetical protein